MQEVILKKTLFGGYDRFEVLNCINALQIKLNRVQKNSKELDELKREINRLKAEIAEKDYEISALTAELAENEEAKHKNRPAELFLKQTEEYADSYIRAARSLESSVKIQTAQRVGEAKKQLERLQASLDEASNAVDGIFISASELKAEYKSINKGCKEILKNTSATAKPEKPTEKKKPAKRKKSEKTAAKTKSPNDDVIELLNLTEEKYKNI